MRTLRRTAIDPSIDLFSGAPGSALVLRGCEAFRHTAIPAPEAAELARAAARPPAFPGNQSVDVLLPSGCTPEDMHDLVYEDVAMRAEAAGGDGGGVGGGAGGSDDGGGGYDLHLVDVWRVCVRIIPQDCLMR